MRALITGAASGIGLAVARRLARSAKVRLALVDRPGAALDAAAKGLRGEGAEVETIACDLALADAPAAAVGAALEAFGGLDAIVSNAGINSPGPLVQCTVERWDAVFAVNTRASWLLAQAAHEALAEANGSMVIVASMSGSNTHAHLGPYAPSKAAVIMLSKVLAQELGPLGVRVNTVSPGMVRTGMTEQVYADNAIAAARANLVPLGRVAEPEDIADAIAFLLSHEARYINGHDLVVDGGVTGNHLGRIPGLASITKG